MRTAAVRQVIEVDVDPATAFDVFTGEVGAWFKGGPHSWNDPGRAIGVRFEPGVGGRLIEVWDGKTGEGYDIGTIKVWEPGARLVMDYRSIALPPEPLTEVEVRFEPGPEGGTRVVLEHRGFDKLPPEPTRTFVQPRAWRRLLQVFAHHLSTKEEP